MTIDTMPDNRSPHTGVIRPIPQTDKPVKNQHEVREKNNTLAIAIIAVSLLGFLIKLLIAFPSIKEIIRA